MKESLIACYERAGIDVLLERSSQLLAVVPDRDWDASRSHGFQFIAASRPRERKEQSLFSEALVR